MKEENVEKQITENLKEETIELEEAKETVLDEVAETLEENAMELETENESLLEEISEDENSDDIDTHIENLSKNDAARLLVKKAKHIVDDAENQLDECKLLLSNDLKEYEIAKDKLKENGMEACETLLAELGYEGETSVELDDDIVVFEPKEEVEPIVVKDVSSGAFTGFIMGLIAALLTAAGMLYVATGKLGMTLDISKLPTSETLNPILKWYSSLVGLPGSTTIGTAVIAVVSLLVFILVYKIRVSVRASSNLEMAKAQLAAAEEYSLQKGTCKEEMDKVDSYINDAIKTLETYQVILNEQKGKLERIAHIEQDKVESSDFHHKSNIELQDTHELINVIKDFMSIPMSEEGKLSGKSSLFLSRAKSKIQKMIDRLY